MKGIGLKNVTLSWAASLSCKGVIFHVLMCSMTALGRFKETFSAFIRLFRNVYLYFSGSGRVSWLLDQQVDTFICIPYTTFSLKPSKFSGF